MRKKEIRRLALQFIFASLGEFPVPGSQELRGRGGKGWLVHAGKKIEKIYASFLAA